ncbi:MAG: helix-turn-helix transcriptional regulator [Agathobacter sp.]|jgi:transcriptional regulator with XRE-family HTH domain|nr:helix-turn-helix transcriptional regulator [Agathobacter sp.]
MEIEKKLKDVRMQAGLTQEQVAEKIMVSRQTVSNWENGKSLPDIVSIMSLSDLYQISIDELLKGDKRMKEKMEKDANIAKANKRVILTTAIITLVVGIIYSISIFVGGAFYEFCASAIQWVMLGIGTACALTLINIKNSNVK